MPTLAQTYYFSRRITPIDVKENSGSNLTDYQIMINLTSSWDGWSLVASDGSDIYFTDSSGNPLYFWFEIWDYTNKNAIIWVKIPSIPANSTVRIYLHYAGINPYSSYKSGDNVFIFFDDFRGQTSLNTNKWITMNNPTLTFSADGVEISGSKIGGIRSKNAINISGKYRFVSRTYHKSFGYYDNVFYLDPTALTSGSTWNDANWVSYHFGPGSTSTWADQGLYKKVSGTITTLVQKSSSINTWYKTAIITDGSTYIQCIINDTKIYESTANEGLLINPPYIYLNVSDNTPGDMIVSYIYVTQYVSPEPSITINPSIAPKDIEML